MKKTIFLAIAFGTSVRDVLRNDTYRLLVQNKNINIIVFAQDISDLFVQEFGAENVKFEKLNIAKVSLIERLLLHFHRAVLRDKCRTIDLGNTGGDTFMLDFFTPIARFLLFILGRKKVNSLIHFLYKIFSPGKDYKGFFDLYKPDLVIVTRVLNYSNDYPMLRMANKVKVPTIALVSSWDNLTSKAFFPFSLDSLVVWNNVLKNEAIELFNFQKEKIFTSGIPRYDLFFRKEGFGSKIEFLKKFGLDSNKKLIMYGTGSSTTGMSILDPVTPEPNIAKYIADQINLGVIPNTQLIVRLHPQANPDHYNELINLPNVYLQIPGKKSAFHDRLFSMSDDIEFGETLLFSDVVVNFASTITIDAAVFNRPIVCANFDMNGKRPYKISPKRIYEFDHYAKLLTCNGVHLAPTKEDMIQGIIEYLQNPNKDQEGRRKIIEQQCLFKDGMSGKRIADFIQSRLDH
jgi:hypothetical protein